MILILQIDLYKATNDKRKLRKLSFKDKPIMLNDKEAYEQFMSDYDDVFKFKKRDIVPFCVTTNNPRFEL